MLENESYCLEGMVEFAMGCEKMLKINRYKRCFVTETLTKFLKNNFIQWFGLLNKSII